MAWNPKSAVGNRISFSEASALSACEKRWELEYRRKREYVPGKGMLKGTLIHTGAAAFFQGDDWEMALTMQWTDDPEFVGADMEVYDDAHWLLDRYTRWYADLRDEIEVVHQELELSAKVPGTRITVMGHIDEVWRYRDLLWMLERKSYGRQDRLDIVSAGADPQLGLYPWLARENGIDLHGVIFDGIYTQRWALDKPSQKQVLADLAEHQDTFLGNNPSFQIIQPWVLDRNVNGQPWVSDTPSKRKTEWARATVEIHPGIERHLADSFDWFTLDVTDAQMERMIDQWLKPAISRRTALRRGATPTRNLNSMSCRFCSVREPCWESLAFGHTDYLVDA